MDDSELIFLFVATIGLAAAYLILRVRFLFSGSFLLLAALLIIYGPPHLVYHLTINFTDAELFERMTVCLTIMFWLVIIGMEASNLLFVKGGARRRLVARRWHDLPIVDNYEKNAAFSLFALSVIISMVTVILFEGHIQKSIEYYFSSFDTSERILIRQQEGGSKLYLFNVLTQSIAPFFSFVLLVKAKISKSVVLRVVAVSMVIVVSIAKISTLQKAPPAIYFIQIVILFVLMKTNRIRLLRSGALLTVFLVLMVPLAMAALPGLDLGQILDYFAYRIFIVPHEVLRHYFAVFPDQLGHTYGSGIQLLSLFTGETDFIPPSMRVAEAVGSVGGSFNALFIADAWAEWSYLGVGMFSLIAGFAIRGVDIYCLSQGKSAEGIALYASFVSIVMMLTSTALTTTFLSGGLLLLPALSWLLKASRGTWRTTLAAFAGNR